MIRALPLIKHFLQTMLYYKINFLSTIGVPIFFLIYSMRFSIFHHYPEATILSIFVPWLAYMVVVYALMNSGPSMIILREEQFFKMFCFIAGGHLLIVFAKFMAQLIILLVSVSILDIVCSLLFFVPLAHLIVISLAMILVCDIPVFSVFLFFGALNLRQETVLPIINIFILIFIYLTNMNIHVANDLLANVMTVINPIAYTGQVGNLLFKIMHIGNPWVSLPAILISTLFYLAVGAFSLYNIKLLPIFRN